MHVIWRGLDSDSTSLELLKITPWTRAEGVVMEAFDAHAYALRYRLSIGRGGFLTRAVLDVPEGQKLTLVRSAAGHWTDGDGQPLPELDGCTDLDIQATPLTNTLPIRRLKLAVGQSAEILAAWIGVPELEIVPLRQRYTRLDEQLYRYENLTSGYVSEIEVDDDGLVVNYPNAFERVEIEL